MSKIKKNFFMVNKSHTNKKLQTARAINHILQRFVRLKHFYGKENYAMKIVLLGSEHQIFWYISRLFKWFSMYLYIRYWIKALDTNLHITYTTHISFIMVALLLPPQYNIGHQIKTNALIIYFISTNSSKLPFTG